MTNTFDVVEEPRINGRSTIGPRPQRLRAFCRIDVGGTNVTDRLRPVLLSVTVILKQVAMHEAHIELDDKQGLLPIPQSSDSMTVYLGWQGGEMRQVFTGFVSDVVSYAQKKQGRRMQIVATSANMNGPGKEQKRYHWDNTSLSSVAQEAGRMGGLQVNVAGSLGNIQRAYWTMANESPFSFLHRIADENGGFFLVEGNQASITPKDGSENVNGQAMGNVLCRAGANLMAWRIVPRISRPNWGKTIAHYFDFDKALHQYRNKDVPGMQGFSSDSGFTHMLATGSQGEADGLAQSEAWDSVRKRGTGWAQIVGAPLAVPGAFATVEGARSGVDGSYKIAEVEHSYSRGGFTTRLDLERPGASPGSNPTWEL